MANPDKVNILIVDDLPEKVLSLVTVLESLGENVVTADSGREALRKLIHQDFAVILLDVNMPEMDGFETAALIRRRRRCAATPIIFITAFGDDMHTAQGYSLGAVDYILSPVVPEILRTKVGVFVELYRKTEEIKRHAEERIALAREQALRAAAEEEFLRSNFLAEASRILVESLSQDAILPALTRLIVPFFGDVACVTLMEDAQLKHRTFAAWRHPQAGTVLQAVVDLDDLDPRLAGIVRDVSRAGKLEKALGIEPIVALFKADNGAGTAPQLALTSLLAVPLALQGRTFGVFLVGRGPAKGNYVPKDVVVALDLATRTAMALENARLYKSIRDADQRKEEFLAMLAHELRNPLAPIRNALQIMQMIAPADRDMEYAREVIDRQVQQLVRLVDDLLDVSRITRGLIKLKLERLDLAHVVARAVETSRPLIEARQHDLTVVMPAGPLWVDGDAVRLSQIVTNLLNNAAKYTETKGKLLLEATHASDAALIRVRDSGVGLSAEAIANIFDLFYQVDRSLDRSEGGLGIGLTLVHRLVQMHGGVVQAHSDGLGKGSEFIVRLPVPIAAHVPGRNGNSGAVETDGNGFAHRILVVDDNKDAAQSLTKILRSQGHEVASFHDGFSALEALRSFAADVLLLDIGMPGMDGYELARRVRELPDADAIVLIAISGYGTDEDLRRSKLGGFDHHLVKPVDPQNLKTLLASLHGRVAVAAST